MLVTIMPPLDWPIFVNCWCLPVTIVFLWVEQEIIHSVLLLCRHTQIVFQDHPQEVDWWLCISHQVISHDVPSVNWWKDILKVNISLQTGVMKIENRSRPPTKPCSALHNIRKTENDIAYADELPAPLEVWSQPLNDCVIKTKQIILFTDGEKMIKSVKCSTWIQRQQDGRWFVVWYH